MEDIKFSPPDITDEEIREVTDTLRSGWITTGPKTKLFEKKIAEYCNTKRAVCLNSATACMEMALRLLGIGPGDEVITSAYTYTASASVVCHVGAKLILVDTAKDSFFMDYDKLEKSITSKTKAIIPVDLAGVMCDYDKIFEIVERKKNLFCANNELQEAFGRIIVLADSAHAFGSKYKSLQCGNVADFTSFSFHAIKNLTTSEGGALTWRGIPGISDDDIYRKIMLFSLHGQTKDALEKSKIGSWEYDIVTPGYKCNMTDLVASLGLIQLKRFPYFIDKRKKIIEKYEEAFADCPISTLQHYSKDVTSTGHLYMVRLCGKNEKFRNDLINKLAEKKVPTNVHYKPLPLFTAYKSLGFKINAFPNAFDSYQNEITLPLHTLLTDEQIHYIINNFNTNILK
ncbi:MAG: DegT/DnrJ/EryC1/StrS family aminotransferase [Clostridia bacterium]|nr:DegT/DnrJ/EryC1/StrS family aminotransferase [Clostridia bacterium]